MSAFTKGIYDVLTADSTLTDKLSTYYGVPAIFSNDIIPENAVLPYIVISSPISDIDFGTKDRDGREVIQNVRGYINADTDLRVLDDIMDRVRTLLHRKEGDISVTGYNTLISDTSGGTEAPTEDSVIGQILTIRMILTSATTI